MDSLLNQVAVAASIADDQTKDVLISKLRNLANTLETPDNTLERLAFGVWHQILW